MNVDVDRLRSLAARALELGAVVARPLSAREVVVDPRVTVQVPRAALFELRRQSHVPAVRESTPTRSPTSCSATTSAGRPAADRAHAPPTSSAVFAASRSTDSSRARPITRAMSDSQNAFVELLDHARVRGARPGAIGSRRRWPAATAVSVTTCVAAGPPPPKRGRGRGGAKTTAAAESSSDAAGVVTASASRVSLDAATLEPCRHPFSSTAVGRGGRRRRRRTAAAAGLADRVPGDRRSALDRPAARRVSPVRPHPTSGRPA